jgi:hypothetical protein
MREPPGTNVERARIDVAALVWYPADTLDV